MTTFNQRRPRFESPAYREAARDETCVLCGGPGAMCCHLPGSAIGFQAPRGSKVPDWLTADCCKTCHDRLDLGDWQNDYEMRMRALCLTIQRRFDTGVLLIRGEESEHVLYF